jgi:hypothetical protein
MPGARMMHDKVMSYLSGLSPAARAMLLRRLEGAEGTAPLEGEMKLILEAARSMRGGAPGGSAAPAPVEAPVPRDVKSRFFAPFAPFVIDERLPTRLTGWIARASLDGIWTVLSREVLVTALVPWSAEVLAAGPAGDPEFDAAVRAMRNQGFAALGAEIRAGADDPKTRQRFAMRLGGEEVLADLADMLALFERLPAIERLLSRLPQSAAPGEASERLMAEQLAQHLEARPEDAAWVAAGIVGRLASPVVYFRCAVIVAGADDVADLRHGPGEAFVEAALAAAERAATRFDLLRRTRGDAVAMVGELKRFHDVVRAANTIIRADDDSRWRNRLVALRRTMSGSIAAEVEEILPVLRRALRFGPDSRPSAADGQDAVRAVAVFVAARRFREALAINELVNRLSASVEQAIDVYGRELIEHLRKARGERRDEILAASDHLLRMADLTHGEEYATLLRKSRDNALQRPGGNSAIA